MQFKEIFVMSDFFFGNVLESCHRMEASILSAQDRQLSRATIQKLENMLYWQMENLEFFREVCQILIAFDPIDLIDDNAATLVRALINAFGLNKIQQIVSAFETCMLKGWRNNAYWRICMMEESEYIYWCLNCYDADPIEFSVFQKTNMDWRVSCNELPEYRAVKPIHVRSPPRYEAAVLSTPPEPETIDHYFPIVILGF